MTLQLPSFSRGPNSKDAPTPEEMASFVVFRNSDSVLAEFLRQVHVMIHTSQWGDMRPSCRGAPGTEFPTSIVHHSLIPGACAKKPLTALEQHAQVEAPTVFVPYDHDVDNTGLRVMCCNKNCEQQAIKGLKHPMIACWCCSACEGTVVCLSPSAYRTVTDPTLRDWYSHISYWPAMFWHHGKRHGQGADEDAEPSGDEADATTRAAHGPAVGGVRKRKRSGVKPSGRGGLSSVPQIG